MANATANEMQPHFCLLLNFFSKQNENNKIRHTFIHLYVIHICAYIYIYIVEERSTYRKQPFEERRKMSCNILREKMYRIETRYRDEVRKTKCGNGLNKIRSKIWRFYFLVGQFTIAAIEHFETISDCSSEFFHYFMTQISTLVQLLEMITFVTFNFLFP